MLSDTKAQLARSYDNDAFRRSQSQPAAWKQLERSALLDRLRGERKISLLEIGAGPGKDSLFFQESGLSVACVDLSEENIRLCRENGLDAQVMDFYSLSFPDASFDAVYAFNCLLHVPKSELGQVLAEIRRVLRPGGLLYMGVYGGRNSEGIYENDWCEPKRFFASYTDEAIQAAVAAGGSFELLEFHTVPLGEGQPHFQSLILRR
jgi:SAM-dependent methyltransferase